MAVSPWLPTLQPTSHAALRLFCFPYAGGSASLYRGWSEALPSSVEVCPIQLPGRETRISERPIADYEQLLDAVVPALLPYLDRPFALFGHSMGALLAYGVAHRVRCIASKEPQHLFVSGCAAPHIPDNSPSKMAMSDAEFVEELRRLNGTPAPVLQHEELMHLLLPLLRADFAVCETFASVEVPPLDCGLTAYGGINDVEAPRVQIDPWRVHTTAPFHLTMFPGDHFFITTSRAALLAAVRATCTAVVLPFPNEYVRGRRKP